MTVRPKLMMSAGIALAGLGLIGAGVGATFTSQVAASTEISSGGLGLSLNGRAGSDLSFGMDGTTISSHFAPISKDLVLKNTGTLDMVSTYLDVTATGCDGGSGESLAKALHVRLTEVSENGANLVYDGTLCSMTTSQKLAGATNGKGPTTAQKHTGVGDQLPQTLSAGESARYRLVIRPDDAAEGLPTDAQRTSTSVNLAFSGFDY